MIRARTIRLEADAGKRTTEQMIDRLTGATPEVWHGNDVALQIAVMKAGVVDNISCLTTITLTIMASTRTGDALVQKTVAAAEFDNSLTDATWADGTKQHLIIALTAAETSLTIESGNSAEYWLVITAITNDAPAKELTIGATVLTVAKDGTGGNYTPPTPAEEYYTREQSDARYLMQSVADGYCRFVGGNMYLWFAEESKWRRVIGVIKDAEPAIGFGDPVDL
jgi:hypothetical protein